MIQPGVLTMDRWATWKHVTVDFGVKGLTYLRGLDKDAGNNPNGAGKSTLVSGMRTVAFQDHQLSVRKNSLKQVITKQTKIDFQFKNGDTNFRLLQEASDLSVFKNGKDQANRTKNSSKDEALLAIGIAPELWDAIVQVNGSMPNPLIRGTGAMRCEFLERAFELDRWKHKFDRTGEFLVGTKRITQDVKKLEERIATLPEIVDTTQFLADIKGYDDSIVAHDITLRKLDKTLAILDALPAKPPRSSKAYTKLVDKYTEQLEQAHKLARKHDKYIEQKDAYASYEFQVKVLLKRLVLPDGVTLDMYDDLQSELTAHVEYLRDYKDYLKRKSAIDAFKDVAIRIAESHGMHDFPIEELKLMAKTWVSVLKPDAKNCPVCGSKLAKHISKADLRELSEALNNLPSNLNVVRKSNVYTQASMDEISTKLDALDEYRTAKAERKRLGTMEEPTPPKHAAKSIDARDLSEKISKARVLALHAKQHEDCEFDTDVDVEQLRAKRARELRRKEKAIELRDTLKAQIDRHNQTATLRSELQDQVDNLTKELSLMPIYQALHGAYSSSGMRLQKISEVMEGLIHNLNEGIVTGRARTSFSYKLTKNRDLQFIASNAHNSFDVRYLNSAQQRIFALNLLLTILPRLPERKRASILILDEVDANCSLQTKAIIANEYLPRLVEAVDCVWCVTPSSKSEMWTSGARELLAVKKNDVSRLIEQ